MRRSFTHWHRRLVHLRVAGGRAAATWDWKAMLRTWREWKMATEEKRREKVTDVTSAVQHELRLAFWGWREQCGILRNCLHGCKDGGIVQVYVNELMALLMEGSV